MADDNAFEIMETDDGPVLRGLRQDLGSSLQQIGPVETYFAVCEGNGNHGSNPVVARMPGLWEPAIGTVVQLCEPNRDAKVCSLRYILETSGAMSVIVFLDDAESTFPDTLAF